MVSIIVFFEVKEYRQRKQFFETELNTTIVDIRNNWTGGRSINYVTRERIIITRVNNKFSNLRISDSVVKQSNSWDFDFYRIPIDGLEYKFLNRYNFLDSNK